jgi:CMP-N,N'-diacetyllegionaminic acid synthase
MATGVVALIPARAGSKRVPGKNTRHLGGHPLLAYTVATALASGVFDTVVVSTEDERTARIARHYGADAPFLRPGAMAADSSPDIEWVSHALGELRASGHSLDAFALLRPTSPLRTANTIRRAWTIFTDTPSIDSLRAVEPCEQHPAKMWRIVDDRLQPLLPGAQGDTAWHSRPTQSLPAIWVQNASLEIAWTRCVIDHGSISGEQIVPFLTEEREGYDVNTERDWWYLEWLLDRGQAVLPPVVVLPFDEHANG